MSDLQTQIEQTRERLAEHQFEEIRCREALEIAQQLVLNDCIALDELLGEKRRAKWKESLQKETRGEVAGPSRTADECGPPETATVVHFPNGRYASIEEGGV